MQQQWKKYSGEVLQQSLQAEVQQVLQQEKLCGNKVSVYIGTDSQVKGSRTDFATVLVFLRKGKGGFMYTCSESSQQKMSIKQRMLQEVANSVEVAYSLGDLFSNFGVTLEVHADINTKPAFKSHIALQDASGYIRGMGFLFKAKPHAFASSCCANRMVQ